MITTWLAPILIIATPLVWVLCIHKLKQTIELVNLETFMKLKDLENKIDAIEASMSEIREKVVKVTSVLVLEDRLKKCKQDLENPTTELSDFLIDMKSKGGSFVRIDPDQVFMRGR